MIGEEVWVKNTARKRGKCPKFRRHYTGPFEVSQKLSDELYEVHDQEGNLKVIHYNRLKPCFNDSIPERTIPGDRHANAPSTQRPAAPRSSEWTIPGNRHANPPSIQRPAAPRRPHNAARDRQAMDILPTWWIHRRPEYAAAPGHHNG